jgi:hypothetical protein
MTERSHYHFALTLTPPQYKVLIDLLEEEHNTYMWRTSKGHVVANEDWDIRNTLYSIKEAIKNQINAEPKV